MKDDRFQIEIADQQDCLVIDHALCRRAVREVLTGAGVREAEISLAIVDDATIWDVNRQHLTHDYPTDVLSFLWERHGHRLEGEIIVSAETAVREAVRHGWAPDQEIVLYIVHGTLHLAGYDDLQAEDRAVMRAREDDYLQRLVGRTPPRLDVDVVTDGACRSGGNAS